MPRDTPDLSRPIQTVQGAVPSNPSQSRSQVYTDESRKEVKCKFYGLRQQLDMGESTYWCQGDFIAPKD